MALLAMKALGRAGKNLRFARRQFGNRTASRYGWRLAQQDRVPKGRAGNYRTGHRTAGLTKEKYKEVLQASSTTTSIWSAKHGETRRTLLGTKKGIYT